jgi:uncharacterized protein YbjQ (UPF0145 family)
MSLFDLFKPHDAEADARRAAFLERQAESVRALQAGGLPLDARERLEHQRQKQSTPQHLWTSDLSVSELLLTQHAGYEPLGQIMGASTYHIGFQWRNQLWGNSVWQNGTTYELDVLTHALADARHLALSRLHQEAVLLGAHGVVGVRLEREMVGWAADLVEFSAIGTAIRLENVPAPDAGQAPFLCALSGQEFWKLRVAEFEPVGIVAGNCSLLCVPSYSTQQVLRGGWLSGASWQNIEIPEFTQGMFQARELAQSRLSKEARALGASGTVGMTIENDAQEEEIEISKDNSRTCMRFNFLALGTAVRPLKNPVELALPKGLMAVPLQTMRVRK